MAIYDTIMDIFPSEQISHRHRKIQVAANLTILTFDVLPIALFEADVLYFSKHMLKIVIPLKIWVTAASEVK